MSKNFQSPKDFLEYLKVIYANPIVPGATDEGFESMTIDELKKYAPKHSYSLQEIHNYQPVIDGLMDMFNVSVSQDVSSRVNNSIAIGALNTGEVNAICVKSPDNKYAILISYGLLTLLHKYLKLILASHLPHLVVYCNRKSANDLTSKDLREYASNLIESYKRFHAPYGAMIKLHPSLLGTHCLTLTFSELFVLCHEFGHFLNGDLEDDRNFSPFQTHPWLQIFAANIHHDVEFKADLRGYILLDQIIQKEFKSTDRRLVLLSLISLFDILYLLSGRALLSHPNPINRLLHITDHFYGPDMSKALERSYDHPSALISFMLRGKGG